MHDFQSSKIHKIKACARRVGRHHDREVVICASISPFRSQHLALETYETQTLPYPDLSQVKLDLEQQ